MTTQFLPADFDSTANFAVLAGRGYYPELMVERIQAAGLPLCIAGFEGETSPQLMEKVEKNRRRMIKVGQLGKLLKSMQEMQCKYAIMVGQIRPRRLFRGLHPDLKAFRILQSLKERNAETIYGALIREMDAIGTTIVDARAFIDDQLADKGWMTPEPTKIKMLPETLEHGIRNAEEIARLDIGQGIVVKRGTVLCVEEFDGTDSMLRRASKFQTKGKIFVKTVKPAQDYRIDVPVFGETTLNSMKDGGIDTAVLAAGKTIMLNKEVVIEKAKSMGIHIMGY